ncbi:CNP1-like family protein [Allochromatium palmeri]|uniref:CNP1-like family protein n=1 Tax=Allochromatium palmeri TaxID=231048 RepID=UPI0012D7C065|nr:CNP1-like family protein [Allochromatium palmeri]
MRQTRILTLYCLVLWLSSALAEDSPFIHEPAPFTPSSVKSGTPWTEALTRLPPLPADSDLIEFSLDGSQDAFRYFIDGRHLSVGPDEVVRYTLVARSNTGARNLSFEGIRCTPQGQYRVFAYGTERGFTPVNEDWQGMGRTTERYRLELWRHHFCAPRTFKPRPLKDMKRSLQGPIAPRQNSGFLPD